MDKYSSNSIPLGSNRAMHFIMHGLVIVFLQFLSLVASAQFTTIFDFDRPTSGSGPYGSLISDGTFLYGTTSGGGAANAGTVFKIMPDGTGYVKLLDFDGAANGNEPFATLYFDGTFLYGNTNSEGANGFGTIFKIKPDGTGYALLLDFDGATNGDTPFGGFISDGVFLYGTTETGGANNMGTIFKIMPDGTGYIKLLDFAGVVNGRSPYGSLFYDGSTLYGMTEKGGTNDMGTIFKIMSDGTGYSKLLDFNGSINGRHPYGELISDGTFLYGTTLLGGNNNNGTVFKIMPDGSGFVKLFDFNGSVSGLMPWGSLLLVSGTLYGATNAGGSNNQGVIFKIQPDGTDYTKLFDFDNATSLSGNGPYGDLISDGSYLYGTTFQGGVFDGGTLFKFSLLNSPTITTFSPLSGPIGTTVTITGTNFSATPTNNIVYFGATQATVTAATPTQLTVTVPIGATYQPITVNVGGLIAYSAVPFTVTFPGGGTIDNCSFVPKVDFTTGVSPYAVSIGDLDGDGKADLAVANLGSSTVSVFRNTSSIGGISYAAKLDFTLGLGPLSVSIGDLDGDGKADLAVANNSGNTVSVFRNTGSVGSISYAAKVDFSAGTNPRSVSIGDLDGDGKVDLVVVNQNSNTVSIFRNTGTIGSISYAAKVDFSTGTQPISVAIGDLDGDGKADLAVVNNSGNTISVFHNTGSVGSISYAAKVDFTAGTQPSSVSIGDLDGDGKADLVVANQNSNTVSIFRNTGTIGSISYAAKVDFSTGTQPISVAIGDLDGDGKADLAVTNRNSNTVSVFLNTGSVGIVSYAAKVDFTAGTQPSSVSIGDLDGDGKADLAVANIGSNTVSVFRNTIGNIPPTITSFSPASGLIGTTVTITGTNFSTIPANNIVQFNGTTSLITSSTTTTITTTVPAGATTGTITIAIGCNTVTSATDFTISSTCVPASERAALIALYNATDGANWNDNSNWLNADESTWFGVNVSGCTVTGLFFQNNNLNGTLPIELGDFTNLETIHITRNSALAGPIPATIGNLTNLWSLQLYENSLTGNIPTSITGLSALTEINLKQNQLNGPIPATIGNLTLLQSLNLESNQLTGTLPSGLFTLSNIGRLYLSLNLLSGTLPSQIGNLTNLWEFSIFDNQFTGTLPTELGNLTNLVFLQLGRNQFTGTLPSSIGNLVNLTSFSVFNNQLSGTVPASLANLVNLTGLGLSVNQFTGDLPAGIGLIPNLNDVSLRDNDFTSIPAFVSNTFTDLWVYGNKLNFGHLEPNIGKAGFLYAPQDNTPGGSATACTGATLTIPFSTPGTANVYQWYKDGVLISGATSATFSKNNTTATDMGNYSVLVTNTIVTGLTLLSDNFVVTIIGAPGAPTTTNANFCNAASVILNASGGTNGQYRWYPVAIGGPAIAGAVNSTYTTPSLSSTTSYYVSIHDGNCESSRAIVTATLTGPCAGQPPVINSTPVSTQIEGIVIVNLQALISDPENDVDLSTLKILIQPSSGAVASIDASFNLIINYTGLQFSGTDQLTIEVCDFALNCTQQVFNVEVVGDVIVYNGMSPNGDGMNDFFYIKYIEVIDATKSNRVTIYNRWGDLIFEIENYDNDTRVFNGVNKDGNAVTSGVYFYKIDFKTGRKSINGYLTVKK